MDELEALEGRIVFIKEVLSRGKLEVTEFGFFGSLSDKQVYAPAGFNAWRESDGELAIGEVIKLTILREGGQACPLAFAEALAQAGRTRLWQAGGWVSKRPL